MGQHILARVLTVIPVLLGVSIFVFLLMHLAPGDVTSTMLGPMASPEAREAMREYLGLDQPLPVQYGTWLGHLLSPMSSASFPASSRPADPTR
jgi:ABC-type dipeptide/oligopeptide/nickel transport system permease component